LTEKRLNRFKTVVSKRQKYLTVVIENVHDPHNVSAILRSADSVGIDKVYLIYNQDKFPRISPVSSASAKKWVETVKFSTVEECFKELKKQKFKIYSTHMLEDGRNASLYELDLTKRVALVFGNEHRGVSDEVKRLSDKNFLIPMAGMVQSLNVSVSVAVSLFEAMRQRENAGMYGKSAYTKKELKVKLEEYINK
jgi:tRNA (guanosine-2'-O-)-methyltransferase